MARENAHPESYGPRGWRARAGEAWTAFRDRDRRRRDLVCGLPFALCAAAVLGLVLWGSLRADRGRALAYRRAAARAFDAGDLATARLAYERLVREDSADRASAFGLAVTLARGGDAHGAIELLDRLAPLDAPAPGFAPAHVALGRELLAAPSVEAVAAAERHLLLAVAGGDAPGSADATLPAVAAAATDAHALLGKLYAAAERWPPARTHLAAAVERSGSGELALMLAQVCLRQGKADEAARHARRAAAHWAARVDADSRDLPARLALAESLALAGEHAAAVAALERGAALLPSEPALPRAIARACAAGAAALDPRGAIDADAAADFVHTGLAHDPSHAALLERLVALARPDGGAGGGAGGDVTGGRAGPDGRGVTASDRARSARARRARALLDDLAATGRAGPALPLALGNDAVARGRADEARREYERALAPRHAAGPATTATAATTTAATAAAANNLACLLAFDRAPADGARAADLPRAAALAESAVAAEPDNPHFRDTRGRIYARQARWADAAADLEFALPALRDPAPARAALAACYDQLGLPDRAAALRRPSASRPPSPLAAPNEPTTGPSSKTTRPTD